MSEKLAVLLEVLWSRWADIASVVWASARLVSRRHTTPATAKTRERHIGNIGSFVIMS